MWCKYRHIAKVISFILCSRFEAYCSVSGSVLFLPFFKFNFSVYKVLPRAPGTGTKVMKLNYRCSWFEKFLHLQKKFGSETISDLGSDTDPNKRCFQTRSRVSYLNTSKPITMFSWGDMISKHKHRSLPSGPTARTSCAPPPGSCEPARWWAHAGGPHTYPVQSSGCLTQSGPSRNFLSVSRTKEKCSELFCVPWVFWSMLLIQEPPALWYGSSSDHIYYRWIFSCPVRVGKKLFHHYFYKVNPINDNRYNGTLKICWFFNAALWEVRCWKLVHPPPPSWLTAQTADQWSGPISLTAQPTANKLAETVNFAGASLKRVGHSYLPFTFLTFFYTWSLRSNFMCRLWGCIVHKNNSTAFVQKNFGRYICTL